MQDYHIMKAKMVRRSAVIIILIATIALAQQVPVVTIDGSINPVSVKYIIRNLEDAQAVDAPCFIILLDTPGGLMTSTEELTKAIMSSKIPVVTYVYPRGGRAASAGVFILYSSHIAAMTPGTRIGAAHPVNMMGGNPADTAKSSDTMMEKVANDAVANVKAMAAQRGRNEEWPEMAIRESESITEEQAFELGVIEIIAEDLVELLEFLDGMVYGPEYDDPIELPEPTPNFCPMTSIEEFLFVILNPNVAYLLLMLGIVGIYFELQNPGGIFPGVVGAIALLLALYAFQILPVNYVGVALIILAVALFILEATTPTFGLLTTGGIVAMLAGSFLLTSGNAALFTISWSIIVPTVVLAAVLLIFIIYKAVAARVSKPVSGQEGLVGEKGIVMKPSSERVRQKYAVVHGEIWAVEGDDLKPGDKIEVERVEGSVLFVKKI